MRLFPYSLNSNIVYTVGIHTNYPMVTQLMCVQCRVYIRWVCELSV